MTFAIIGLGYISSKHLKAIDEVGGELLYACDRHDNVGHLDRVHPNCQFTKEPEVFFEWIKEGVDYTVICTPNYLHYYHCELASPYSKVICEKPLCISEREFESLSNKDKIYPLLQMRLCEDLIDHCKDAQRLEISYHCRRGDWYDKSWKTNNTKSGGLNFNIGIHLLDLICYLYGEPVHCWDNSIIFSGDRYVEFNISLDKNERKFIADGQSFIADIGNLHTDVYRKIITNNWYNAKTCKESILLAERLSEREYRVVV